MAEKKPKDKNTLKPTWEITFVAENLLIQTLAIYIAHHDGELPSEEVLHKMTRSCVDGSIFFNNNKKKYGIHDRVTDNVSEEDE